jgi:hypothetical protein
VKRTVIVALLALLALWPIAQRILVETHAVDPWELWGWGMYTRPRLDGDVRAFGVPGGRALERSEELKRFELARRHLGRLASPRAAAEELLARHPELEAVRLLATQLALDPETDRIVAREETFVIHRDRVR